MIQKELWTGLEEEEKWLQQRCWLNLQPLLVWLHQTQLAVLIGVKHCNKFNVKILREFTVRALEQQAPWYTIDGLWAADLMMFKSLLRLASNDE